MIEAILALAGCSLLAYKAAERGDNAVKGAVRSAKRTARDVGQMADEVLQPCAAGRKPHKTKRVFDDMSGDFITVCTVCRREV